MMHNEQHKTPVSAPVDSFQGRVQPWMMACFGAEISADGAERNHRFLEESLELVQACGCTASEAHQLVDYVYGRPVGERAQEVGGVMVTLAALCLAQGLDMHAAGETELARIWTKVEAIRAKQAARPKHSPLPAAACQVVADERAAFEVLMRSMGADDFTLRKFVAVTNTGETYKNPIMQDHWKAWQARAALAAAPVQADAPITDTSLVDLCAFMNAASISNIPILLSAQSAGALVKAMTTSAPVQPVAVPAQAIVDAEMHGIGFLVDGVGVDPSRVTVLRPAAPVQPVAVPDGWKLVPVRMTPEMKSILKEAAPKWNAESIYGNLLDAAPAAPAAQGDAQDGIIRDLNSIGMKFAAALVALPTFTSKNIDWIDRENVMREVNDWRTEWDKVSTRRAAIAAKAAS